MLAVFIDGNVPAAKAKAQKLKEKWRREIGRADFAPIDDRASLDELRNLAESMPMFAPALMIEGSFLFESNEISEAAASIVPILASSAQRFVLIERQASVELSKIFKKYAEVFDESKRLKERERADFSFADAFLERNRVKLWISYQARLREGAAAEELHGQLFWAAKTLLIIESALAAKVSPATLGLHPFVVEKNIRALKHFPKKDLDAIVFELAILYHKAHAGGEGLENSLERWILNLKSAAQPRPRSALTNKIR